MIQAHREMDELPKKLKVDTILEAVLEIRFEHSGVPEIVVGQLAGAAQWQGYANQRLPFADFPPAVRDVDPNLRYQAWFQLGRPEPGEVVKIGPRVISVHVLTPYPGWDGFSARIAQAIEVLFDVCPEPLISRVGLRYINALNPTHGIKSLWDLNFEFKVAGGQPADELTASYQFHHDENTRTKVTLASRGFVEGNFPAESAAFVDVDISTPQQLGATTPDAVRHWIENAHDAEKRAFFALWPDEILKELREA